MFSSLLDLIFPLSCLVCGAGEQLVCPSCQQQLRLQPQELQLPNLPRVLVACDYEEPVIQRLIKGLKYENLSQLARLLSPLLIQILERDKELSACQIMPIPLHSKRLKQREYNQSQLLADGIAQHFGWPINTDLQRIKNTKSQARLSREQRLKNIGEAFRYQGKSLEGENILLIDDVLTTGATIEAAAVCLLPHQPKSISALALARNQSLKY